MAEKRLPLDIVIFCGGRGTRLSEKTREMPKPLIELGEYPILWHIMKIFSHYNYKRFVLTLGYRGEMIIDYFMNTYPLLQNFSIKMNDIRKPVAKDEWDIAFVHTGLESKTARRLLLCRDAIYSGSFLVTYGDGVADIDLPALIRHHNNLKKKHDLVATVTITRPYSKYGIVQMNGDVVEKFLEKPLLDNYINVGFMVVEPDIFDYIHEHEDVMFEDILERVARDGRLGYYIHEGFWHAMDTYKDYVDLNAMWRTGPKWKIWTE